jgi:hypothetical protein
VLNNLIIDVTTSLGEAVTEEIKIQVSLGFSDAGAMRIGALAACVFWPTQAYWYTKQAYRMKRDLPMLKSLAIEFCSVKAEFDHRSDFRKITLAPITEARDEHSHPTAAAIRTTMNNSIDDYIKLTGREVYSISMSQADERRGHRGNRFFYQGKDLSFGFRDDPMKPTDVIKMSDTGYYTDLPTYLNGQEVVLYEIVPYRVAGGTADATFCFNSAGRLEQRVNGDALYEHELWNFSTDYLLVPKWNGVWQYLVEKIHHPQFPEFRIIGLFPRRFVYWPASWMLSGRSLERRQIVDGDWCQIQSQANSPQGLGVSYTSIGKPGMMHDVYLPTQILESLMVRARELKSLDLGSIEMYLEMEKKFPAFCHWLKHEQSNKTASALLFDFLKNSNQSKCRDVVTLSPVKHAYTPINKEYRPLTEVPVSSQRNITPPDRLPLVDGSVCPTKSRASTQSALDWRIVAVKNDKTPPGEYKELAVSFMERFIPQKYRNTVVPYSTEILNERLARPTQKMITRKALDWWNCEKEMNKAFMKREGYNDESPARIISTLPASTKTELSMFCYVFADIFKECQSYAFGLSPEQLAHAIGRKARHAMWVICTDFSKFDGSLSAFLRWVEQLFIRMTVAKPYIDHVLALHAKQMRLRGVTNDGLTYDCGHHRLSGSPETSIFNTMINMFVQFCAYVKMGHTHDVAFESLGIYGGDDGCSFDLDPKALQNVAKDLGLTMTVEKRLRGEHFPLLGRIWYNAWTGEATSTADFVRQLGKLHLTSNNTMSMADVMIGKARGLIHSDSDTLVLGKWAKKVLYLTNTSNWTNLDPEHCSYFVRDGGMMDQPDQVEQRKAWSKWTNYDVDIIEALEQAIETARSLDELFVKDPLATTKPKTKILNIRNGEIQVPETKPEAKSEDKPQGASPSSKKGPGKNQSKKQQAQAKTQPRQPVAAQ